jgi:hypothetical protein
MNVVKVDGSYPVKANPIGSDKVWGYDSESQTNKLFEISKISASDMVNVQRYPSIQEAINAANGKWVFFPAGNYEITETINLPVGTKVIGYDARIFCSSHIYIIEANGNNIIKGLEIEGAGSSPFNYDGRGINMVGVVGNYKSGLIIEDCFIHDIGFYGIYHQFASGLNVKNTKIFDVGYAGIMGLSVKDALVYNCHIKGIDYLEGGYGISFTRFTIPDTLEANPRSRNCTVENCLVEDILQWKGLDTHGGYNIKFINNTILNCLQGIGIVGSGTVAPINCSVLLNHMWSTRGNLGYSGDGYGVVVAGIVGADLSSSADPAKNIKVIGNTIIGMGKEATTNSGAIRFRNTENLQILSNIIDRPLVAAILIQHTNFNFSVIGNTIEDPYSNSALENVFTWGIRVQSTHNHGVISSNTLRRRDGSLGLKVAQIGIGGGTAVENRLIVSNNQNNFITPLSLPSSFDIVTDNIFNSRVQIKNTPSINNQQLLFNEGFSFYADNEGGQNELDPVAFSIVGRPGTTVYCSPRSGSYKWFMINAETIDMIGKLRVANQNTLEPTGSTLNISGLAESGNIFKRGLHYTTISAGTANNYPANNGLSFVIKSENSRILEYFANTTGTLWYRTLTTGADNTWHRLAKLSETIPDAPSDGNFYVRRNGAWEIMPT